MFWFSVILAMVTSGLSVFFFQRRKKRRVDYIDLIKNLPKNHPVTTALQDLINRDGAGSWPPRSLYGTSWPPALRPYHVVYMELSPYLATDDMAWEESELGLARMKFYRAHAKKLLREKVNIEAAKQALNDYLSPEVYNGLFACIAISRHAYRWATIPIVKIAQEETVVEFPPELDVAWDFLRHRYGVTSPGGNVTSNFYCNYDTNNNLVYAFNVGMPEVIRSAEYHFGHIFPAMEKEGVPIYYHMVTAILSFEREDRRQSLKHLRSINEHIKPTLKIFFDSLVDSRISKKYWMRYVQGIQGWAAGNIVEGKYIEYDGLSGNQLLLLHCIDSFIGLEPYLPTENTLRYIPHLQRELSKSFSQHNFRRKAEKVNDTAIIAELDTIAKQLRLFRAAHRSRATPYLSVPAPERLIMTAGKSVLESDAVQNIKAAIDILDAMLLKRFQQTR